MISKKESIEIIKAKLENAINNNTPYNVSIRHELGCIIYNDVYSEERIDYEYKDNNDE